MNVDEESFFFNFLCDSLKESQQTRFSYWLDTDFCTCFFTTRLCCVSEWSSPLQSIQFKLLHKFFRNISYLCSNDEEKKFMALWR